MRGPPRSGVRYCGRNPLVGGAAADRGWRVPNHRYCARMRPAAVLLLALWGAVALTACGSGSNAGTRSTQSNDAPLAHPMAATCGEIGFGNKRFPTASEKRNLQVAGVLAESYRDTGADPGALKVAFSTALLSICNKTEDATYQPAPQARAIAEQAHEITGDDPRTDFAKALVVVASGAARGKEEEQADAQFVVAANAICRREGRKMRPLVRRLTEPAGTSFKSAQAARLNRELVELLGKLNDLAAQSDAKNAREFTEGYSRRARRLGRLATRYGRLSEHYYDNLDSVIDLNTRIGKDAIDLSVSTGDVDACGAIFGFS